MNKKLLAVAVAGALAAPGVALAQASSVTISGMFKVGVDNISYSGATSNAANGFASRLGNNSETRVSDNSSRIIFGIREDLGNGLAAIAQLDMRFNPATAGQPNGLNGAGLAGTGGGNTWVGLQSNAWGKLTFGRHDLHYGKIGDSWNSAGAGSLQAWSSGIFDSIGRPTGTGTSQAALANQSRTNQVVRWDSPNWSGFDGTIAWSANPLTQGAGGASTGGDLGVGLLTVPNTVPPTQYNRRRGDGWNINPRYNAANWGVEYSYWNAKADLNTAGSNLPIWTCNNSAAIVPATGLCTNNVGGTVAGVNSAIQDDQLSHVVSGYYNIAGFRLGLAWNRSRTTSPASGMITGDRQAWAVPISYTMGPNLFGFVYVKANNSKDVTNPITLANISGSGTGAKMYTLTYQYELSKRTALGLTYSEMKNDANANYGFFYNSPTAFGSTNANVLSGEKSRLMAATIRHFF
jgi:predicted porin